MARRTGKAVLATVPCPCGGMLKPIVAHRLELEAELGFDVVLVGSVPALRCSGCGELAIPGPVLEEAARGTVLLVLDFDRRLSGREAQFLRKTVFGVGQSELATRMGLSRPTVARWEQAQSLSSEQDFNLRGLAMGRILKELRVGGTRWKENQREFMLVAEKLLQGARQKPAPRHIPRLELRQAA